MAYKKRPRDEIVGDIFAFSQGGIRGPVIGAPLCAENQEGAALIRVCWMFKKQPQECEPESPPTCSSVYEEKNCTTMLLFFYKIKLYAAI